MHVVALTTSGEMYSWGDWISGNEFDGYKKDSVLPSKITINENEYEQKIIQVVWGFYHSMCLTDNNFVYSWGVGENGRLGHGDSIYHWDPK